jgi:ABC-2 type transport system ATP-binding protein
MNAIEVNGISKSYKGFTLDKIDLVLPEGSIMGLVGENGAGKSTLIKLIMNAEKPDSGFVNVLGVNSASNEFTKVKNDIGVVLDEAYFPDVINANNVNKIMKNTYENWSEQTFFEYLSRFALDDKKAFKDFSRGMKMKLAIAVALSHNPKLLVLDEATSGLDPMVRDEVLDIIKEFAKGDKHSVLLSSHIVSDLEKICDFITFIHRGRLLLSERKNDLLDKYVMIRTTADKLDSIPKDAVKGIKIDDFEIVALVKKSAVPEDFVTEHTTLEDIILLLAKGDDRR